MSIPHPDPQRRAMGNYRDKDAHKKRQKGSSLQYEKYI